MEDKSIWLALSHKLLVHAGLSLFFLPFGMDGQYTLLSVVRAWSVFGGPKNNNDHSINSYIVPYGSWTDPTQQINSSATILHKHCSLESLEKHKRLPTLQHICSH